MLNYSKTTYLLFNKQPHVPVCSKLRLYINKSLLKREDAVKYLRVWIDDKLNWSYYIENFSLHLVRSCSMFRYLWNFVTDHTLSLLACCIIVLSIFILFMES